jgi:hypothetical protein
LADENFLNKALLVARRFLGGVRRIVSVKFYVEPISFANNVMRIDLAYKEVSNSKTDFGDNIDWNLFKKHDLPPEANGMPQHYQRIILGRFRIGKPDEKKG